MSVTEPGKATLVRFVQPTNAWFETFATPDGMEIRDRATQPSHIHAGKTDTPSGMSRFLNTQQFPNACSPIFVTVFGMSIAVLCRHPKKAALPMDVGLDGIFTFISQPHPLKV